MTAITSVEIGSMPRPHWYHASAISLMSGVIILRKVEPLRYTRENARSTDRRRFRATSLDDRPQAVHDSRTPQRNAGGSYRIGATPMPGNSGDR